MKLRRNPAQRTAGLRLGGSTLKDKSPGLKESKLKVFDIPIALLVAHKENPNEQTERTFDHLVERIREEGFDEPIIVYPHIVNGKQTNKFMIASGHHRVKAAEMAGLKVVPAVIREGWTEDRAAIELVTRNALRGNLNPHKFTELYDRLKKRYDPEQLKKMMGLSEKKAFNALYKQVASKLTPKQRKKLDEAKETITSVDDLSKVLNTIFREHGNEVDHSFVVFTYGGKKHYYIQTSADTARRVEALKDRCEAIGPMAGDRFFNKLLSDEVRVDNIINGLNNENKKAPAPDIKRSKKLKLRRNK